MSSYRSYPPSIPPSVTDASFFGHEHEPTESSAMPSISSAAPSLTFRSDADQLASENQSTTSAHTATASRTSHRSRPRSRTAQLVELVLAQEERQVSALKTALHQTGDRLEMEMRRSEIATIRADQAESRSRDALAKLSSMAIAKRETELALTRAEEDASRYKVQLEETLAQLRQVRQRLDDANTRCMEAEQQASAAEETARSLLETLEHSREFQWAKSRTTPPKSKRRWKDGFSEGKQHGWIEGYEEGLAREREHAIESFAKFISNHETEFIRASRPSARRLVSSPPDA